MEGRVKERWRWNSKLGRLVQVDLGREDETPVAPAVFGDLPDYTSPIDGRLISGKAQRREDLKRNGCRPYEEGERQEAQRRREQDDARLERNVNETVERWWHEAPTQKREALARDLMAGADVNLERR